MNLLLIVALLIALALVASLAVRAIGGNIGLIDDWKQAWKFYSTYALLLLGAMPEIFNAVLAGGYLDGSPVSEEFSWWVKIGAAITFAFRLTKQVKRPPLPDFSDQAGA